MLLFVRVTNGIFQVMTAQPGRGACDLGEQQQIYQRTDAELRAAQYQALQGIAQLRLKPRRT